MINGVQVPFTPEEEVARDTEEAAYAAGANDRAFAALREERNRKLVNSDWISIKASDDGTTTPAEWKTYRKALRDLPADTSDPTDVTWPTEPS